MKADVPNRGAPDANDIPVPKGVWHGDRSSVDLCPVPAAQVLDPDPVSDAPDATVAPRRRGIAQPQIRATAGSDHDRLAAARDDGSRARVPAHDLQSGDGPTAGRDFRLLQWLRRGRRRCPERKSLPSPGLVHRMVRHLRHRSRHRSLPGVEYPPRTAAPGPDAASTAGRGAWCRRPVRWGFADVYDDAASIFRGTEVSALRDRRITIKESEVPEKIGLVPGYTARKTGGRP